jgi:hypothetical protein
MDPLFSNIVYKKSTIMPPRRQAGCDTPRGAGREQQGRGRGQRNRPQPQHEVSTRFKGNCAKLQGHIFDCSDYKQADKFVNTLKHISEYVGAAYKHGGDIRSSIINETRIIISVPAAPTIVDPQAPTPAEIVAKMISKGEIDSYIKRKLMLDDNVQKAYSLVLGQCTDLSQSKLKQQAQWAATSQDQDVIALTNLIKTITFRFEDQKFLLLALY